MGDRYDYIVTNLQNIAGENFKVYKVYCGYEVKPINKAGREGMSALQETIGGVLRDTAIILTQTMSHSDINDVVKIFGLDVNGRHKHLLGTQRGMDMNYKLLSGPFEGEVVGRGKILDIPYADLDDDLKQRLGFFGFMPNDAGKEAYEASWDSEETQDEITMSSLSTERIFNTLRRP